MITMEIVFNARSLLVRPISTAEEVMGRLRKRSMIPSLRSCAIAAPEKVDPNTTV